MKPAEKILHKVRRSVESVAYGSPLYQKLLSSGDVPDRLSFILADPWPGQAEAGLSLINAQPFLFDNPPPPHPATALRNLRAVGTSPARLLALQMISGWLQNNERWNDVEWSAGALGERIAAWIGFYDFYAHNAPPELITALIGSLYRQWKHLVRALPPTLRGRDGLRAIKGLMVGGLNFEDGDKALGLAFEQLKRLMAEEILPDGGHISRSPARHLLVLRYLIDIRNLFRAAEIEVPEPLRAAITAMVPVLKFYRYGDGGLGLFHGGGEETSLMIDAVLTQAEVKSRVLRRLPETGYERVTAGRSLLLVDGAAPPPHDHDAEAHAGLAAFEFSQGRERIIVNCGIPDLADSAWRMACAATAAHSTLTISDTNAAEIVPEGGVVHAIVCEMQRYELEGNPCVEVTHDGYSAKFGIIHKRHLCLSADGDMLTGMDTIIGNTPQPFTIRWHLHPQIQSSLTHGGQTALLRTASGTGWRLRVDTFPVGLEMGLYCGTGTAQRSHQLKISGTSCIGETRIRWTLTREKKA